MASGKRFKNILGIEFGGLAKQRSKNGQAPSSTSYPDLEGGAHSKACSAKESAASEAVEETQAVTLIGMDSEDAPRIKSRVRRWNLWKHHRVEMDVLHVCNAVGYTDTNVTRQRIGRGSAVVYRTVRRLSVDTVYINVHHVADGHYS
jgi:hypothetical protein